MKTIKRILTIILAISLTFALVACGDNGAAGESSQDGEGAKVDIVVTTFHIYDWVKNIIGDDNENINLQILLDTGVDFHSYQPSTKDIADIMNADLFIYNGGSSDFWVGELLEEPLNENLVSLNLMDSIEDRLLVEEVVEGMEAHDHSGHDHAEDEHDHAEDEHDHAEDEHDHTGEVIDEHVWLSIKNAIELVANIEEAISGVDSENAEVYSANAQKYIGELEAIDAEYESVVSTASYDTILVADRFPFRYLVEDYGINYHAAFVGCSAETEASFETVAFLTDKVETVEGLDRVIILEGSTEALASTIINNTTDKSGEILTMNSMQSVTAAQIEDGTTYLSIMNDNLTALTTALA